MKTFKEFYTEGLWANINAKKKRGAKSARKGSKAYKAAKSAGDKLRASKENEEDAESSPGRVKRAGASCKGTVTELRKRAKKYGGEKGKMYHWCANMKSGKKKSEEDAEKKVSKTRAKCQAKAKRKYDVWPSAYASGYVQKCVNRGGNIK